MNRSIFPQHRCLFPALLTWFTLFGSLLLSPFTPVSGQEELYELGKRLQRFEVEWQAANETERAASAKPMQAAVSSFFSAQIKQAAKQLDQAWFTVRGKQASMFESQAVPFSCRVVPTAQDAKQLKLSLIVRPFYKPNAELTDAELQWKLTRLETRQVLAKGSRKIGELSQPFDWELEQPLPAGEYTFSSQLQGESGSLELADARLSVVNDFENRLTQLEKSINAKRGEIDGTLFYSVRMQAEILRKQIGGEILETDYSASRLLALAEAITANPEKGWEILRQQSTESDVWLTLAQQRNRVPIRVRAPNTDSKLPVLFLFHGAGGSENMFFETCGAGRCVQLGLERNWLVVAPRQGFRGLSLDCSEMLDELDKIFEIDRSRVFLVGHSMGGGQVVTQASLNPDLVFAAAVIGGGGRARDFSMLSDIPWFIAAGELDFGRPGAVSLQRRLERAGADVRYMEKPNVEHMVIVQAATDEVFEFFDDTVLNPKKRKPKITKPGPRLEFRIAEKEPGQGLIAADCPGHDGPVYLHAEPVCTDIHILSARSMIDEFGRNAISIRFKKEGAKRMLKATSTNKNKLLAIVLNGKVVTAPLIQSEFSKEAMLTGQFTREEIEEILNLFK